MRNLDIYKISKRVNLHQFFLVSLVFLVWATTLAAFDQYLGYVAEEFRENFSYQNQAELAASNIFKIGLKLNIISRNPFISCATAERAGHIFFESRCVSGVMNKTIYIGGATRESITIKLNFSYPKGVQFLIYVLLVIEGLSVAYIVQKILEFRYRAEAVFRVRQMAHDIRSPLTALTVLTEKLSQQSPREAQLLAFASKRIHGIASGMLLSPPLKNIASKVSTYELARTQLCSIAELRAMVENVIGQKRLEFQARSFIKLQAYFLITKDRTIEINSSEFEVIISNIINNAYEATNQGFITLTIEDQGNQIFVEIRDSGKGMAPKTLEQVGTKGFSYDKKNGNGLGLSNAIRTIKSWRGELSVFSQLGIGTTVKIALPIKV